MNSELMGLAEAVGRNATFEQRLMITIIGLQLLILWRVW